jgi:hypothetical protein
MSAGNISKMMPVQMKDERFPPGQLELTCRVSYCLNKIGKMAVSAASDLPGSLFCPK